MDHVAEALQGFRHVQRLILFVGLELGYVDADDPPEVGSGEELTEEEEAYVHQG